MTILSKPASLEAAESSSPSTQRSTPMATQEDTEHDSEAYTSNYEDDDHDDNSDSNSDWRSIYQRAIRPQRAPVFASQPDDSSDQDSGDQPPPQKRHYHCPIHHEANSCGRTCAQLQPPGSSQQREQRSARLQHVMVRLRIDLAQLDPMSPLLEVLESIVNLLNANT